MKVYIYPPLSINEIGQRSNQEDSIIQWSNRLFVLCDGMGGHEKGEVASQTVCQSLATRFEDNVNPDDPFTDDLLREALEYAYQQLDKYADGSPKQMGTTLTLLYIHAQGVTAAHIGDSRIYHIRPIPSPKFKDAKRGLNEGILYQSRDHSLVFDLYQAGEITYEEMGSFAQKNIITRAMTPGKDNRHRPDIIHITDIQPNDYFYLCSDGMLEQMTNDELSALLSSDTSDEKKREQLIATTANNQDNHSAWLIHIKDVVKEPDDEHLTNEEPTARCNAINILPQFDQEGNNVQIVEGDDVVVVSKPKLSKMKWPIRQIVLAAMAILIILLAAWIFLFRIVDKKELSNEEQIMQSPIKHFGGKDRAKETKTKDTIIKEHEFTGNQQPVNAPRGNDTTRNLQNR